MRTKNELYQEAMRTVAARRQMARARAEEAGEDLTPFSAEGAFGEYAVVAGFDDSVGKLIDRALTMTGTPGGKRLAGSQHSEEPGGVNRVSPVRAFRGYPR